MLLALAWFFAFGCQVGNAAIPFEKSASVLEVHLTEALLVERGRFLFTIVGEIPTVVLQRCFQSSGARGGQGKVSMLVSHNDFLCSGTQRRVPSVCFAQAWPPSPSSYMVFLCGGSVFRTLASDVRAGSDGGIVGTGCLKVRKSRSRLVSSC
jgi:hypothetical protein